MIARSTMIASMVALIGCQWVADLDERRVGPNPPSQCSLELPDSTAVRVGNFVPGSNEVVFCLRPDGSDQQKRVPAPQPPCPTAVPYEHVSAPVAIEPGLYEARVVESGQPCGAAPLATSTVEIADGGNTLAFIGGGDQALRVLALRESPAPSSGYGLRLIHAAPAYAALTLGPSEKGGVPTVLTLVMFPALPFGAASLSEYMALGQSDSNGYFWYLPQLNAVMGAAVAPADLGDDVIAVARINAAEAQKRAFSIWIVGGVAGAPVRAILCDETRVEDGFTACGLGQIAELRAEIFSATQFGPGPAYAKERLAKLEETIGSFDADVLCLEEVWPASRRMQLAKVAEQTFPHQLSYAYDFDTPFSDPTGLDGKVPAPRTTPLCSTAAELDAMNAMLDCLRDKCADPPDETGMVSSPECGTSACAGALAKLLGMPECGLCMLLMLVGDPIGDTREVCSTVPEPYVFQGSSGSLLLSRYPIEASHDLVAPSTWFRRDAIHARIRLSNGSAVDTYCGYSPPIPQPAIYTGVYGAGATGADAWRNERRLFFDKLFAFIDGTRAAPRVVVLGSFGTAPAVGDLDPAEPDDYALLTQRFPLAAPPEWVPQCTSCAENPLTQLDANYLESLVLMTGSGTAVGIDRTHMERIVEAPAPDGRGTVLLPLSARYGLSSRIQVAQ